MKKLLYATLILMAGFTGQVQATVITNGSFETGDFTGWTVKDLTPPFYPIRVEGAGGTPGFGLFNSAPTDGNFAATHGFDGGGPGIIRISQDITVINGLSTIEFDYRAGWNLITFCNGCLDRLFDVNIETAGGGGIGLTGFAILTAQADTTVLDTGNLTGSIDLSAFIGQTVHLAFDWTVPNSFSGPAFFQLDNVRSTESQLIATVPEPGPLALLGFGLFGLGFLQKRRR